MKFANLVLIMTLATMQVITKHTRFFVNSLNELKSKLCLPIIIIYIVKVPKPLKNRDFVTERSWLVLGNEYLIFNHSVNHAVSLFSAVDIICSIISVDNFSFF